MKDTKKLSSLFESVYKTLIENQMPPQPPPQGQQPNAAMMDPGVDPNIEGQEEAGAMISDINEIPALLNEMAELLMSASELLISNGMGAPVEGDPNMQADPSAQAAPQQ
jgi:hypothetical protein